MCLHTFDNGRIMCTSSMSLRPMLEAAPMMSIKASSAMRGGWMSGGVGGSAAESENRRAMGIFILSSSDWLPKTELRI